jgi:hypothetical protein
MVVLSSAIIRRAGQQRDPASQADDHQVEHPYHHKAAIPPAG